MRQQTGDQITNPAGKTRPKGAGADFLVDRLVHLESCRSNVFSELTFPFRVVRHLPNTEVLL
jgi:hypothetical protein